jgi:hypothetical protein
MSVLTGLSNKIQFLLSKQISDPEADAYARQQAIQARQDAERREREQEANQRKLKEKQKRDEKQEADAELKRRSEFSMRDLFRDTAGQILSYVSILILVVFILYGGHIAANEAIGYRPPFRILSFVFGSLGFFYYIPRLLYKIHWKRETVPMYTFLPISVYHPTGFFEKIIFGPFSYEEDQYAIDARVTVEELYKNSYKK